MTVDEFKFFPMDIMGEYAISAHDARALNALEKARNDSRWRKVAEYEIDHIKNPEKYAE